MYFKICALYFKISALFFARNKHLNNNSLQKAFFEGQIFPFCCLFLPQKYMYERGGGVWAFLSLLVMKNT